jgi:hypothetical protein
MRLSGTVVRGMLGSRSEREFAGYQPGDGSVERCIAGCPAACVEASEKMRRPQATAKQTKAVILAHRAEGAPTRL